MASLAPSVHTYVTRESSREARPSKRAKTEIPRPKNPVTGCSNAIIGDGDVVFVFEGDRHFWTKEVENSWKKKFWRKGVTFKGAPYQVYTVKDSLAFLGVSYEPVDHARFILKHMLGKKWVPICCFPEESEAEEAVQESFDVSSVEVSRLENLFRILMEFTERVEHLHFNELVMGAIDQGPTFDTKLVKDTMMRESFEEAGAEIVTDIETDEGPVDAMFHDMDKIDGIVQLVGFSDPFKSRKTNQTCVSAMFVSRFANNGIMDEIWSKSDSMRRPGGLSSWRCPHAWYKVIPGIDKKAAEKEKAIQETRNGRWVPIQEALQRELFMDVKNKNVLTKTLALIGQ